MATSNKMRALNGLPFDFEDGLKVKGIDLSVPGGAAGVIYDTDNMSVQSVLDKVKPLANYEALRSYTGRATQIRITDPGISGFFYLDGTVSSTSEDNGGTIIIGTIDSSATAGNQFKRWKRHFDGPLNVMWFGAKGDGVTDDTVAIQKAIDYAASIGSPASVLVPSGATYKISVGTRTGIAAGVAGLILRSNVTFIIDGTIKAANNMYGLGTLSALIKSTDAGISDAKICGSGVVDGNRGGQGVYGNSVQCDNIHLYATYRVQVFDIYSVNANGNGVLITKPPGGSNHVDTQISNVDVAGVNNIGIQVSHSETNLIISNNQVSTCGNNCIDVYQENGTTTPDSGVISICGNTVSGGLVGIFPETVSNCSVIGNSILGCAAGIQTNRINGATSNIIISGNNVSGCIKGIVGSGDTNGVTICTNTIAGFTEYGIGLIGLTVSRNVVHGNTLTPDSNTVPVISLTGTSLIFNQIHNNTCTKEGHNQSYGLVTTGTIAACTLEPIKYINNMLPVRKVVTGSTTSGGTLVIPTRADSAGKLLIKATTGGGRFSVWSGSFVSTQTGDPRVAVVQDSTAFIIGSANHVSSVVGSASTLDITVTWSASGTSGNYQYCIEYF